MAKNDTINIESAKLHEALMIGGRTESTISQGKLPGVKIELMDGLIQITWKTESHLIPLASVFSMKVSK